MVRMVNCVKLGRELPGLEAPPFPGELGQRIFDNVSADAWRMWGQHATIMINHYGLQPAEPETRKLLRKEMQEFFFGENARMPDGWVDPSAAPARGGAPSKGGPAPRKK